MLILSNLKSYLHRSTRPLFLGLGNFDGVHLGHQSLLQYVAEKAHAEKGTAAVLTFREHPQRILHPKHKPALLMSSDYKMFLLKEYGIDLCFWLHFTKKFSEQTARSFIKEILVKQLQVREVCLGYNAHFGHGRLGNVELMRRLASQMGFLFEEIKPVMADGGFVSSSRIRKLVREARLEEAASLLGRPFGIWAKVVKGTGRGRSLGFPTANLRITSDALPPHGVYPVMLRILELERVASGNDASSEELKVKKRGPWLQGALNYGHRPSFEKRKRSVTGVVEVFILDFKGELYGKGLEVCFYPKLRSEKKFEDVASLKRQIREDVDTTRHYFAGTPKKSFTKVVG